MTTSNEIIPAVKDIQLTATLPQEMVTSQTSLIHWCNQKVICLYAESAELKDAFELARDKQWNYRTLQSQYNKSVKEIHYYEKMKGALEAGFYIIPNFPVTLFAIRTKQKDVKGHSESYWGDFQQTAQELPEGDGEYKNPFPVVYRKNEERNEKREIIGKPYSYPSSWDELSFPITMAKPVIMQATDRAMVLKIFDQFGIMPATRNEDPVIIGQIKMKVGYRAKLVSFMIAWHLNTNVL